MKELIITSILFLACTFGIVINYYSDEVEYYRTEVELLKEQIKLRDSVNFENIKMLEGRRW